MNRVAMLLTVVLCVASSGGAAAHGRHSSSFDLYFGAPLWWDYPPYYHPPPYYYEPRTIIIEREPPVYIQRPSPLPAPVVWYYCPDPAGYYPYVASCKRPWVSVDPRSVAPPATTP